MKVKFYFCNHCKNVAVKVVDHKVPLFCCGEKMTELVPGTVDAAVEKHLPEYTVKNGIVSVHHGCSSCSSERQTHRTVHTRKCKWQRSGGRI